MASTGKEITLGLTQIVLGTATSQTVIALITALQDRKPAAGMDAIHTALDAGTDPRLLARQVVDYLRALLLIQMGNLSQVDLAADIRKQAEKHARAFTALDVLRMIKSFNAAATDLRGGWQPSLPLELALAECLEMPSTAPSVPAVPAASQGKDASKKAASPQEKQAPQPLYQKADPREMQPEKPGLKAASEPAAEGQAGVTLAQVLKAWRQICAEVKSENQNLNALLNSGHPLEVKGNVLVLGYASDILRSKVDLPEQMKTTRRAIAKVLGADLSVKCVVTNARNSPPPNVKADGMVAAALKAGGEIVDTQE